MSAEEGEIEAGRGWKLFPINGTPGLASWNEILVISNRIRAGLYWEGLGGPTLSIFICKSAIFIASPKTAIASSTKVTAFSKIHLPLRDARLNPMTRMFIFMPPHGFIVVNINVILTAGASKLNGVWLIKKSDWKAATSLACLLATDSTSAGAH